MLRHYAYAITPSRDAIDIADDTRFDTLRHAYAADA